MIPAFTTKNAFDWRVTAPRQSPFALDASGNPQPAMAGVDDNALPTLQRSPFDNPYNVVITARWA